MAEDDQRGAGPGDPRGDQEGDVTECCGQPRAGRFCSECGKRLDDDPIHGLLKHCRMAERKACALATNKRSLAARANPSYGTRECLKKAEAADRAAAQWKARGDALAALLAKVDVNGDAP